MANLRLLLGKNICRVPPGVNVGSRCLPKYLAAFRYTFVLCEFWKDA